MRAAAFTVIAVAFTIAPSARADDSYVAPVIGPVLSFGGHAGAGTSDSILGGAGLYGGVRFPTHLGSYLEFGGVADFKFSHTFVGDWAFQGALYLKHDVASLWLNSDLGVNLFYGIEPAIRYIPGIANSEIVTYGMIGFKLLGFTFALAAGAEIALAPAVTYRVGFIGETRLAFDLVEIVHLCSAIHSKRPLP